MTIWQLALQIIVDEVEAARRQDDWTETIEDLEGFSSEQVEQAISALLMDLHVAVLERSTS